MSRYLGTSEYPGHNPNQVPQSISQSLNSCPSNNLTSNIQEQEDPFNNTALRCLGPIPRPMTPEMPFEQLMSSRNSNCKFPSPCQSLGCNILVSEHMPDLPVHLSL